MKEFLTSIQPWHFYFAIGITLVALEMLTFTLDLLWLGLGALAGAVVAWLLPEVGWLHMLTAAVAAVAFAFLGSRLKKPGAEAGKGYDDPIDFLIDKQGKVIEAIAPQHRGIVKIGSEMWSAASTEAIAPGEVVIVIGRSSTVLDVRRA